MAEGFYFSLDVLYGGLKTDRKHCCGFHVKLSLFQFTDKVCFIVIVQRRKASCVKTNYR
jgi:hypothetical protein